MEIKYNLKKLCQLTILATLFIVPLIYPLKVTDSLYAFLLAKFQHSPLLFQFWQDNIEPLVFFGFSPLVLKECVANGLTIILFVIFFFYRAFSYDEKQRKWAFLRRHFLLLIFITYAGLSLLYTPTFYYSFRSWFNLVCFGLFFIMVLELADSPLFLRKALFIVLVVGALQSIVAILQHLNLTSSVMLKFDDPRNRMGAFIGHNTGLSMFLIPPFFISLVMFLFHRRKLAKVLLLIFITMLIFVILVAQSRGTWVALLVTIPLFLLYLRKYTGFTLSKTHLAIGCAVVMIVVLSQIIPNPLKSPEVSFRQRLGHFSLKRLKAETRLRVLVCSIPLINQHPLFGSGIGSFQYVYPKVQGEYFVRHPDSILTPTAKRTQRAHNEYLQTVIELGLIGLLLILIAFYQYLREGWSTFLELRSSYFRGIMIGIFFSITALLIQAFFDFPFHIAPLGLYFIFLVALWSGNKKLYGLPEHTPPPPPETVRPATTKKFIFVGIGIALLVISPYIASFNIIHYSADIMNQRASSFTKTFYSYPNVSLKAKLNWLNEARNSIERALRLEPLSGISLFKSAEIFYLLGSIYADLALQSISTDDSQNSREQLYYRSKAKLYYEKALFYADLSLSELRIHSNYYLKGLIYRDLGVLAENAGNSKKAQEYYNLAKKNFMTSVIYTPAYAPANHELAELLLKEPHPDGTLIQRLRRNIAKYDPDFFNQNYVSKLCHAEINGEYEKGLHIAKSLVEIAPDRADLRRALFHAYLYLGDLDGARSQLEIIKRLDPDYAEIYALYYIYSHDWPEAKKWLDKVLVNKDKKNLDVFEAIEPYLLRRLGRDDEARKKLADLLEKSRQHPAYLRLLGELAFTAFDEKEEGVVYIEEFLKRVPSASPMLLYLIANYYAERGESQKALDCINRYKTITGINRKLRQLEESLRKKLAQ